MIDDGEWGARVLPVVDVRIFNDGRIEKEDICRALEEIACLLRVHPSNTTSLGGHLHGGGLWNITSMPRIKDLPKVTNTGLGQFRQAVAEADLFDQVVKLHERCLALEIELAREKHQR